MKSFKVKKGIQGQLNILGLPLNLFFVFLGAIVIGVINFASGFSFSRFLFSFTLIVGSYFILRLLDSDLLNALGNEKFPDSITIDSFK
jgi:hypothetical protein